MRRLLLPAILSAAALSACVSTVLPVNDGRIVSRAQFVATVGGTTVQGADTILQIGRRWTFSGKTNGAAFQGEWDFRDGFWCRRVTKPSPLPEDCQVWVVRGDNVTVTRDQGRGESFAYKIIRPRYPA